MDPTPSATKSPDLAVDEGYLASADGLRLFRRSIAPKEARAHVALVHGYGDHSGRSRELMEQLARAGFAGHVVDLRGHGQSDGVRAHVDRFGEYLTDVDALVAFATERAQGKKLFVYGHSLGALIAARWLLSNQAKVAGAVLSSPLMALNFDPPKLKLLAAKIANRLAPRLHMGNELHSEDFTHDEAIRQATDKDPLYVRVTTPRWFMEMEAARLDTAARAAQLTLPALVFVGEADKIISPPAAKRFFAGLGSPDKTLHSYEGFFHECHHEVGREKVVADVVAWLARHL